MKRNLFFAFFGLLIAILTANYFASNKLNALSVEYEQLRSDSAKFIELKQKYKSAAESKKILEDMATDISKTYFSATISKKEFSSSTMVFNLLVLNGDELDMILKKLLNANLKITKLWIDDVELGYIVSIEVSQ